jgi:hypothetical protein
VGAWKSGFSPIGDLPQPEYLNLEDQRIDPQAWLTDVLARIAEHKVTKLDELLPWRYAETST